MIKIGLVGEDPSDTTSIINLLNKKYKSKAKFKVLLKTKDGNQLDIPRLNEALGIEFKDNKCNFVIYIRDLDSYPTDKKAIKKRYEWFNKMDSHANGKGLFLLNIWELEALILADIDGFNKHYRVNYKFKGNPIYQKEPKEALQRQARLVKKEFKPRHCPAIFAKLNLDTVRKNCGYFNEFIAQLDSRI